MGTIVIPNGVSNPSGFEIKAQEGFLGAARLGMTPI